MSDDWRSPRPVHRLGVLDHSGWAVRLFGFVSPGLRVAELLETVRSVAAECLDAEELKDLSDEFEYFRVGFLFCHIGRRGSTIALFHFGRWVDMPEVFHSGWYSYGHSELKLEALDFREPVACLHDAPLVADEINRFVACVSEVDKEPGQWDQILESYLGRESSDQV